MLFYYNIYIRYMQLGFSQLTRHNDYICMLHQVFGGDATTNRVLQAFCDMELHPTPPIGLMPLGTQVNISISLGWVIQ